MQSSLPIKLQEVFKLTNLGLNPDLFKFGNLTFESEKYICVKDGQECVIVDTSKGFTADRKPMKADAILMHKSRNVIALRAQTGDNTVIQVFDLDTKQKLKQCDVAEQVTYWKWLNNTKIGIVGKTAVYHVDITNQEPAQRVFERAPQLANCQIMSYGIDSSEKWCFLVGLYSPDQKTINCQMQLFFTERRQQQLLEGYAGCFADIPVTDNSAYKNNLFCFCEKKANETVQKLHFMEIGNPAPGQQKFKKSIEISMPPDAQGDFPVLMQSVESYGVIFFITKMGYFYLYEISQAVLLFRQKISDSLIFVSAKNPATDGMICINKAGQVISINVDDNTFIPYLINVLKHVPDNVGLAFKLAQRFHLKGADELFVAQFNKLLMSGDYQGAARVARDAPGTLLRNQDTINKFKQLQSQSGPQPILIYFSTLLETTKLNEIESLELARPVLQQGKMNLIEEWIKQDKLSMTEQLGDLIRQYNPQMALYIFKNNSPDKFIQGLIETNQYDKIMPYCQQTNYSPDWAKILRNIVPVNPEAAVGLAKMITNRDGGNVPKVSIDSVVQIFLENGRVQETTAFLLEALKSNRPDEGHLQTKLFEINLMSAPNVAEGIFQLNIFTHYDRERVARLCEQAGLYGRALQNYTSMQDAKRVMLNTHAIPKEQLIEYFGKLSEDDALQCMYDLLKSNRQNISIVAEIAVKYSSKINTKKSIEVLESLGTNEGLLFFLANTLPQTDDPDIYFKYIEACTRLGNYKEVERVIRETNFYDPIKVKDFLKEQKLPDPRPLIYLCDQHNFIEELTKYLYKNRQNKFIEIYLFKVNTAATPKVLGTLLELDCDEIYIKQLLNSIRVCPIPELVEEFEKKGKLKLLQGWLEARYEERIQEPALHNALAMIYIDINKDPQDFLIKNPYYDSKVVGKYCEERNPDLAFIAYKRAWGSCDQELVDVTNKNYLYRMQARYLVERQSPELWAYVLKEDNPHRKQVIDQVVQTALPETKNADDVSTTVKAFMDADMPNELIELLERIVLHNSDFANNKNLQNLLILTAIKADKTRVMDYINRLDNYDGQELAKIAKKEQYQLYDEALCIYKKFGEHVEAVRVLIQDLKNVQAATEYAEKINKTEVWSEIGKAQLDNYQIREAIDAFIKARDPSMYAMVIGVANQQDCYEELVQYLLMARSMLKEQMIDTELIIAYAKCGQRRLPDLETFISEPNQADLNKCGDRCFDEKLYEAARILYSHIGNNQRLASTLVKLKQYQAAFDAAKKADIPKVWKEVCFACVRAKEFRTANLCGQKIIILPDHLEDLIKHYERFGFYEELIQLLEQGMSLERTHSGIFTHLGVLYAKYQPQRLMDHIRTYCQKLQIPMLIEACKKYQMWPEVVFLNSQYGQFDQAIITMIEHSPTAWKHDLFSQSIVKVSNYDLYYRAMIFYLEEEPMLLNDLLKLLAMKVDLTKCVQVMKRTGHIALIAPFLKSVQSQNISAVNEALNQIYLDNEDYESLRASIKEYDSFESLKLAQDLERHELLECRRIAALLYRKNKKFQQSIDISKKDELYKDAMETVAESRDPALAEDLMRFIMNMEDKELFAAMLYTCYELVKPDVALEVAWRCGLYEYVMPYFIQFVKDLSTRVDTVQKKTDDIKKKEEKTAEEQINQPLDIDVGFLFPGMMGAGMNQMQALMPPPGMMPNLNMSGFNYGGMNTGLNNSQFGTGMGGF